jgi:hypothetical protein
MKMIKNNMKKVIIFFLLEKSLIIYSSISLFNTNLRKNFFVSTKFFASLNKLLELLNKNF